MAYNLEVPITPKYFFFALKNKSLHLFVCLNFFYVVKVTKSSNHLSHNRASKGHGSIHGFMSQTDLHRIKSLQTCMQRSLCVKQGIDPYPLLAQSCDR